MTAASSAAAERRNTAKRLRGMSSPCWRDLVLFTIWRLSPAALSSRQARMRFLANYFDGMTVEFYPSTNVAHPTVDINTTTLQNSVNTWNSLDRGNMKHNWALVLFYYEPSPAPIVWNDSYWAKIASNMAAYGNIMKNAQDVHGIFWDTEHYRPEQIPYWGQWPEGAPGGQSLADTVNKARDRGRQVMDALRSTWPDVNVVTTFGMGHSYQANHRFLPNTNEVWQHNELQSPFIAGMEESCQSAGSRAQWVDGGMYYWLRDQRMGDKFNWWQQVGAPQRLPVDGNYQGTFDIVQPSKRATFRTPAAQSAYDVYAVSPWRNATDAEIQDWIMWAMRTTRSFAWFYSERIDFWEGLHTAPGKTPVTAGQLAAIAEGRRLGRL